jgi:hypothetical protein
MFNDLFTHLHVAYIFSAGALFIAGIYVAPTIVDRNIQFLLVYPRWVAKLMEKYFSVSWGFVPIFFIILFLNNLSLFTGFLSGLLIIMPYIMAFLTGFHVAVIGYDLMGWKGIWHLLVNPVAWLEFPAAWISFGMGIRLSMTVITDDFTSAIQLFSILLPLYLKYVFVLLLLAAILESGFIRLAERFKDKE